MSRLTPGTHWLRENHLTRSPHRLLIVDTETTPASANEPNRQVLRLWAARYVRRHDVDPKRPRTEDFDGHTVAELLALVNDLARADSALWLMTHNLNFDLAVTELPVKLTEDGWRMTEGALTTSDPWCRFARGRKRLTIADTWSYLPTSVSALADLAGVNKRPLPDWQADEATWLARARDDVDVTTNAIIELMGWWDAGCYGNWSLTGPATGWSSYRHRRPGPRVLVEPDTAARELEARAVTGGRRGVARVGYLPLGLYADLDITTAHLTVMANYPLPARRLRSFDSLDPDSRELRSQVFDVLAECVVNVRSPRYPWDSSRGLFYPVGRFRTVLAGPEIRAALARHELESIGRGYVYQLSDHMAGWSHWLAGLLDERATDTPPTVRLAAKHWSRCVPGKWAGHTSEVVSRVPDPRPGWALEKGWLAHERKPADFLRLGHELWTIRRDEWAEDAFPAILAWIQSHTRLALGTLLDMAGPAVVTHNTDGMLVNVRELAADSDWLAATRRRADGPLVAWLTQWCERASDQIAPFVVRPKGAAGAVTVISPQHLIIDDERRLAGIPRSAVNLGGRVYSFATWPKLRLQLQRDNPAGYSLQSREVDLSHVAPAGWLLDSGEVVPASVDLRENGTLVLPPTWDASAAGSALAPLDMQHATLKRALVDYGATVPQRV